MAMWTELGLALCALAVLALPLAWAWFLSERAP